MPKFQNFSGSFSGSLTLNFSSLRHESRPFAVPLNSIFLQKTKATTFLETNHEFKIILSLGYSDLQLKTYLI